jgi:hypothetical protein
MTRLSIRLVICLALVASAYASSAATIVAVKTGRWESIDTWNCTCLPKRTDAIIIPQNINVSINSSLMLGPSKDNKSLVIAVAGTLNLSSGSIQLDPIDRVMVMPGGRITTKSLGGMIFSGIYALFLEGETSARGPLTLGDGFSPTIISAITAEKGAEGITLSWRSGTDVDVNYYYVTRSYDGISYEAIGKIDGRGSLKQKLFTFVDKKQPSGVVHYRIELTSTHGISATVATLELSVRGSENSTLVIAAEEAAPNR